MWHKSSVSDAHMFQCKDKNDTVVSTTNSQSTVCTVALSRVPPGSATENGNFRANGVFPVCVTCQGPAVYELHIEPVAHTFATLSLMEIPACPNHRHDGHCLCDPQSNYASTEKCHAQDATGANQSLIIVHRYIAGQAAPVKQHISCKECDQTYRAIPVLPADVPW